MTESTRGFGVAGEYPPDTIRAIGQAAESAGYHSFWLSQPPEGDSLESLAAVAALTGSIRLGIGAIPFTLRSATEMAERVHDLNLPLKRLRLGVGSGTGRGSLDRLRDGVRQLRELLNVEIVVAPLGPKMCSAAGEVADSVLLNWLTPDYARISSEWVREGANTAGRMPPRICTYVRCALGPESRRRLEHESARYRSFPHYAAHFKRQGVEPVQTTIAVRDAEHLQERLRAYEEALDEVIVRAITPNDTIEQTLQLVIAAQPS